MSAVSFSMKRSPAGGMKCLPAPWTLVERLILPLIENRKTMHRSPTDRRVPVFLVIITVSVMLVATAFGLAKLEPLAARTSGPATAEPLVAQPCTPTDPARKAGP